MAAAAARIGNYRFSKTKYGSPLLIYDCVRQPDFKIEFSRVSERNGKEYYRCIGCFEAKKLERRPGNERTNRKVPLVRLEQGQLLDDPENTQNPHFCRFAAAPKIDAKHHDRKHRQNVAASGVTPSQAYEGMVADIAVSFPDEHVRQEVEQNVQQYNSVRAGYYRQHEKKYPVLQDVGRPANVWGRLIQTWDSLHSENREIYVIHQSEPGQPLFLLFGSQLDMQVAHRSKHFVIDGTFKFNPQGSYQQMYTVHAFIDSPNPHFAGEYEAFPVAVAILPNKTEPTYERLFEILRDTLIDRFGNTGLTEQNGGTAHFDFEQAAINAFKRVFPQALAKGCAFHFAECIRKQIQNLGLQPVYSRTGIYDQPNYVVVHDWVRKIIGFLLLLPNLVVHYWQRVLCHPPVTGDNNVDRNLQRFADYVDRQWCNNQEKVDLWNHFYTTDGPRTNNHAEGFHRSLSDKFKSKPHMKLNKFMVEYQLIHNRNNFRMRAVLRGERPKQRRNNYVQNDARIRAACVEFYNFYHFEWANQNFPLPPFYPDRNIWLDAKIDAHLARVSHLLGENN